AAAGVGADELLPVLVVLVPDHERDGRAGRDAAADAGEELGRVGLDLLPAAAAVAALPPPEIAIQRVEVDGQAGREPLGDGDEAGSVGLAGGEVTQLHLFAPGGTRSRTALPGGVG